MCVVIIHVSNICRGRRPIDSNLATDHQMHSIVVSMISCWVISLMPTDKKWDSTLKWAVTVISTFFSTSQNGPVYLINNVGSQHSY
jgi:hypothetical protein